MALHLSKPPGSLHHRFCLPDDDLTLTGSSDSPTKRHDIMYLFFGAFKAEISYLISFSVVEEIIEIFLPPTRSFFTCI